MKIRHKLIFGSGFRVIALAVNVGTGFFLMPFIVHNLGDRIYGYWTLAASVLGYYGLMDLGIVSAVQYYVARAKGENNSKLSNQTISTAFFAFGFISALIILVTLIISCLSFYIINEKEASLLFGKIIVIMGVGFAVGFPFRVFLGVISANLRFDIVSCVNIIGVLFRALLIFIVLKFNYSIIGLALVSSIVESIQLIIFYPIAKKIQKNFTLNIKIANLSILREIFNYSLYNFIYKIAQQMRFFIQPFIISGFINVSAVTHYSIASRLSLYFMSLMISCFGMLSPLFSLYKGKNDNESIQKAFVLATKISVCFATFVSISLMLYGFQFIHLWMGSSYLDAYIPMVILITGVAIEVSQFPSVSFLQGVARHKLLAYITILESILNLLISVLMIKHYGLIGVALGTAIPMIILKAFVQPYYVCKAINLQLLKYYSRVIMLGFIVTITSVLLSWIFFIRNIPIDSFLDFIYIIFIQILFFLPLSFFICFDKNEKRIIVNTINLNILSPKRARKKN